MASAPHGEVVGDTILDQLAATSGGAGENRLRAMVKAPDVTNLMSSINDEVPAPRSPGVGFRFRGSKDWNGIEIFLDRAADTHTMRFYRMQLENGKGTVLTTGEWMHDVYAEDLERIFQEQTGLDTHL